MLAPEKQMKALGGEVNEGKEGVQLTDEQRLD
jgi:hypothetical protein